MPRRRHPAFESGSDTVRVALYDGACWIEWRGQQIFWASRWYEAPRIVYDRAKMIEDYVASLV